MKYIFTLLCLHGTLIANAQTSFPVVYRGMTFDVTTDHGDSVRISHYPQTFTSHLSVSNLRTNFLGGNSWRERCDKVAQRLTLYRDPLTPPIMSQVIVDQVRNLNSIDVQVQLDLPFDTGELRHTILLAAQDRGLSFGSINIINPLKIDRIDTRIVFQNSLSETLGSTRELEQKFTGLNTVVSRQTGMATISLSSMDLMCDLIAGSAKIEVTLKGNEFGEYIYQSILSPSSTRDVHQLLVETIDQATPGTTTQRDECFIPTMDDFSARQYGTYKLTNALNKLQGKDFTEQEFAAIYGALFREDGMPYESLPSTVYEQGVRISSGVAAGSSQSIVTIEATP